MKKLSLSLLFFASTISLSACNLFDSFLYKEVSFEEFKEKVSTANTKNPSEISFSYSMRDEEKSESGKFVLAEDTNVTGLTSTEQAIILIYGIASSINSFTSSEDKDAKYYTKNDGGFKVSLKDEEGSGHFIWDEYLNCTEIYSRTETSEIKISTNFTY